MPRLWISHIPLFFALFPLFTHNATFSSWTHCLWTKLNLTIRTITVIHLIITWFLTLTVTINIIGFAFNKVWEFRRIPQLKYDTAFHFFDMKCESYCLEKWHYWDNTQYMLIKVYYYDKQIKSSKVETVSVINTSMCVYFYLLKMLLSL